MPRSQKTAPTNAAGGSKAKVAGAQATPKTLDGPTGLWSKLLPLSKLPAAVWGEKWRETLDMAGLMLLFSAPERGRTEYTLVDVESLDMHRWRVPEGHMPDLALAMLFNADGLEEVLFGNKPAAPAQAAPKAAAPAATPTPAPAEPPAAPETPLEEQPAQATSLAKARKLVEHELLPPKERQKAKVFLGQTGLTEYQVQTCIARLNAEIAKAEEEFFKS